MKESPIVKRNTNLREKKLIVNTVKLPEAEGKHPIIFPESASGTRLERLELCNPSSNIEQAHPYS